MPGETLGVGEILLEERAADDAFELELCRFRLQEGARLRDRHENFEDFSTEYDTVDFTYAPWAGKYSSVLNPALMQQFAREMIKKDEKGIEDISFAMAVLAGGGQVGAEAVREYIRLKTGVRPKGGIRSMYDGLLNVLKEEEQKGSGTEERNVFLI